MRIARGAEAELIETDGMIEKRRVRKRYRHPTLDERLRTERTKREVRLLEKAARCVAVPDVLDRKETSFTMEKVGGERLRDHAFDEELYAQLGKEIGHLHDKEIIHGDLTTSNVLVREGGGEKELVFIDFGLGFFSSRTEDRATDLRLLKQVLESTHPSFWRNAWKTVEKTYREAFPGGKVVLKRLSEIEQRGRYISSS